MVAYTYIGSYINLLDGKQGIEKSTNPADDNLIRALNAVAGITGEASWAAGTVEASMKWATTKIRVRR
jgi:hypothetical protein